MKKLLIALVVGAMLALPMSAMAMDALTQTQLDAVEGQAGLTVGFGTAMHTAIDFSVLCWGDPDGVTGATGAGWLVIDGDVSIALDIAQGETLAVDVAYTSGGVTLNGVAIPAGRAFLALALPSTTITVNVPSQLAIGFNNTAGSIGCTLGNLNLGGLGVSVSSIDNLYIWCHD
jgi:hypothetical protein